MFGNWHCSGGGAPVRRDVLDIQDESADSPLDPEKLEVTVYAAPCPGWDRAPVTERTAIPTDPAPPYVKWIYNPLEDPEWSEHRLWGYALGPDLTIGLDGSICVSQMGLPHDLGCFTPEGRIAWVSVNGFEGHNDTIGGLRAAPDGSYLWFTQMGFLRRRSASGDRVDQTRVFRRPDEATSAAGFVVGPDATVSVVDEDWRAVVYTWTDSCGPHRVWSADGRVMGATRDGYWVQHTRRVPGGYIPEGGLELSLVTAQGEVVATVRPEGLRPSSRLVRSLTLTDSLVYLLYASPNADGTESALSALGFARSPLWEPELVPVDDWFLPVRVRADGVMVASTEDGLKLIDPSGRRVNVYPNTGMSGGCLPALGADGSVVMHVPTVRYEPPAGIEDFQSALVVYEPDGRERYRLELEGYGSCLADDSVKVARDGTAYYLGTTWALDPSIGRWQAQERLIAIQTDVPGLAQDAWATEWRDVRGGSSTEDPP